MLGLCMYQARAFPVLLTGICQDHPRWRMIFVGQLMNCGREFLFFFVSLSLINRKVSKEVVRTRAEQSYHLTCIFALQTWKESVGTTGPNCIILSCQMLFAVHAFPLEGRLANIHVRQGLLQRHCPISISLEVSEFRMVLKCWGR